MKYDKEYAKLVFADLDEFIKACKTHKIIINGVDADYNDILHFAKLIINDNISYSIDLCDNGKCYIDYYNAYETQYLD